jgi:methionine synthase II (cobalamin-independent)
MAWSLARGLKVITGGTASSMDRVINNWYLFQDAVEALNHALEGIPEDRVRVHVCWGGRNGPHTNDPSLQDALPLMLQMHAGGYAIEAANPRHEHEWEV